MTQKELDALKEKYKKNKDVQDIFAHFESIFEIPYFDGFVTTKTQILRWQEILKTQGVGLSSVSDDKSFERAHKFLTELKPYYDNLEYFKSKLTAEQVLAAEAQAKSAYEMAEERMAAERLNEQGEDE
jgi:hypothetical protein